MRDHPSHSNYAMSGGMWGGTHNAIPNLKFLLLNKNRQNLISRITYRSVFGSDATKKRHDILLVIELLDISIIATYLYNFSLSIVFDHIDIFILDVEGGELEAMQTMNWNIEVDYLVI
jgi:hypothetical protein